MLLVLFQVVHEYEGRERSNLIAETIPSVVEMVGHSWEV